MGSFNIIVLGAGASRPYGLPTGDQLIEKIKNLTAENIRFFNYQLKHLMNPQLNSDVPYECTELLNLIYYTQDYKNAGMYEMISEADYNSMDELISLLPEEYIMFGKQLITAAILNAEKAEIFRGNPEDHWYRHFWRQHRNVLLSEAPNVAFITFNYDRSLEYYLFRQFQKHSKDPMKQLSRIKIFHVYGSLGNLSDLFYGPFRTEGADITITLRKFNETANRLRTIYEAAKESQEVNAARGYLKDAKNIYITGFGFDATNVKLLFGEGYTGPVKANAYDRSPLEKSRDIIMPLDDLRLVPKIGHTEAFTFNNNIDFIRHCVDIT